MVRVTAMEFYIVRYSNVAKQSLMFQLLRVMKTKTVVESNEC